jgi:hypothetical protein
MLMGALRESNDGDDLLAICSSDVYLYSRFCAPGPPRRAQAHISTEENGV